MDGNDKLRNRIFRKFEGIHADSFYAIFIEFSNLYKYYQFVDYHYGDTLADTAYEILKRLHRNEDFFRFDRHRFLFIGEFDYLDHFTYDDRVPFLERRTLQIMSDFNRKYDGDADLKLTYGAAANGIKQEVKTIKSLIQMAEFTMNKAKQERKPYLIADENVRAEKQDFDEFTVAFDTCFAIEEFSPFFQPIIAKKDNRIVGCESLVRWQKDTYRIISAGRFKDIAIDKNYFDEIDLTVIKKSFRKYQEWLDLNLIDEDFVMAINLSVHTLLRSDVGELVKITKFYGLKPKNVEFDLDEYLGEDPLIYQKIYELKSSGYRVAIDAFHFRKFSLISFLHFDVDTIKIDKSLLPESEVTEREEKLFRAIVEMSRNLQVRTLVKGIENRNHFQLVSQLDVDYLQGYYFTKPIDADNFAIYLQKYQNGVL